MSGRRRHSAVIVGLVAVALLAAAACDGMSRAGQAEAGARGSTVTVFAAASLTESFTRIASDFEAVNPGATVVFNFGGSSGLARQINQGAPADVFASADQANMMTVMDAGNGEGHPTTFVKNQLVIAVSKGNPMGVAGLADLAKPGMKVALCAEQVPCGAAAKRALDAAGVSLTPVTLEPEVKSALAKVRLGEVDAALVYRTDAKAAAADVAGIEFPESAGAINEYPIVVLKSAANKSLAQAFVAYVLSGKGMAVLAQAGFRAP